MPLVAEIVKTMITKTLTLWTRERISGLEETNIRMFLIISIGELSYTQSTRFTTLPDGRKIRIGRLLDDYTNQIGDGIMLET